MTKPTIVQGRVSVITACWNVATWLTETVDSIRAQTYPDVEYIIIDDGSTDPEALRIFDQLRAEGITVLTAEHTNLPTARNNAIRHSTGEFLVMLDADDRLSPEYLERAVAALADPEVSLVAPQGEWIGEREGRITMDEFRVGALLYLNVFHVTCVFRRKDYAAVGGFMEDLPRLEDFALWLSILGRGGRPEVFCGETDYYYRVHKRQMTAEFGVETLVPVWATIYPRVSKYYLDNALDFWEVVAKRSITYPQRKMLEHFSKRYKFLEIFRRPAQRIKNLIAR